MLRRKSGRNTSPLASVITVQNTIRKVKRAREIGKKIRAVNIIAQKWLEYMYHPDGMTAEELAQHY